MSRLVRSAGRRSVIAAVAIVMLVGLLAPIGSASAATVTYRCTFGPPNTSDFSTFLYFHTTSGGGNDSVQVQGIGTCSDGTPLPYGACRQLFQVCPLFRSFTSTMVGGDSDVGSSSSVHFGRCDADVSPNGSNTQGKLMIPHADIRVSILINGQRKDIYLKFRTIDTQNHPAFPGALPTRGVIYDPSTLDTLGSISITSRIGGQCPPAGTYNAFYQTTFTTAQ